MTSSLQYLFSLITYTYLFSLISCQIDYTEVGPEWSGLCINGLQQSPINFPKEFSTYNTTSVFKVLSVNYGSTDSIHINTTLYIYNNDEYRGNGANLGYIIIEKNKIKYRYDLLDFHFHVGSEHSFNGDYGEVELHIKHKKNNTYTALNEGIDNDKETGFLNIAVLFKVASNYDDPNFIHLDYELGLANNFNLGQYTPLGKPFFYYHGSQTQPPCAENVDWVVSQLFETISFKQYQKIKEWISITYLGKQNVRRIKNTNNRMIYYQYYSDQVVIMSKSAMLNIMLIAFFLYVILIF